ncbi:MAG: hypothetical protein EB084_24705, partial [Proteobacteria bacterium]|nr:hypothetical protein [Pseudomonadota bacterium]
MLHAADGGRTWRTVSRACDAELGSECAPDVSLSLLSTALRTGGAPMYPLAHVGIFAVQMSATAWMRAAEGQDPLTAQAFVPDQIAQAEPRRLLEGLVSHPGSQLLEASGQVNPMRLRMTAPRTWAARVPMGYVVLGDPAMRVYARNAPLVGEKVDIGGGTLSWQTRYVNVKSYFTNELSSLALDAAPRLEQKKAFWGKRAVEAENGHGEEDKGYWFFTGTYKGGVKPFRIFGQEAVGQWLQANENELGQVLDAKLGRYRLLGIGSVGIYLNFGGSNVNLYHALLGTQKTETDRYSGVLFEASTQVPGLELQLGDGFVFKFTDYMTVGNEAISVLVRYTSKLYFRFRLHSDVVPKSLKFYIVPPILSLTPKGIDLEHFPADGGRPLILNGACAFVLELGLASVLSLNADCATRWFYQGLESWGLSGTSDVSVSVWIINVKLMEALAELNFGRRLFLIQAKSVIAKYSPLAVSSIGFALQLGKAVFERSKSNTWDNYLLKFSVTAKFVWVLEVPITIWVWANGEISVSFKGADPINVDPNSNEFKGDLWLYGIKTRATYTLKRSSDGTSTEMFAV